MKLRVLIADDEPLARLRIRDLLGRESDVEIVAESHDGPSTVAAIAEFAPELLFLDVQMPELDGFQVLDEVPAGRLPVVVFVTAFDHFALRAFESHAIDYLLKPFDDQRFAIALDRARAQLRHRSTQELEQRLRTLVRDVGGGRQSLQRLVVRTGSRSVFVPIDDVDWFEAEQKYVRIHVGERSHLIRDTLSRLETVLDPSRFLRVHRSSIVNVDRIAAVESYFAGEYILFMRGGARVKSGRGYRARVQQLLGRAD